jgi:hypothetical protein
MIGRTSRSSQPLVPRNGDRWRKPYRGRASVEREFGRLKHDWALLPLRVRGIERVKLRADLTILAKLACARLVPRLSGVREFAQVSLALPPITVPV